MSERESLFECPREHRHFEGSAFCTVCGAGPVLPVKLVDTSDPNWRQRDPDRTRGIGNYTVCHFKVRGTPFGLYRWRRNLADGFVVRAGPLGHVQLQVYRMRIVGGLKRRDGRRGKHGIALHFWGVSGRRRKRGIDIAVIL